MKKVVCMCALLCAIQGLFGAEVRLLDLEPNDAQQILEKQDQSLNYAPKIETNVPAVRYLGKEPHHVLEDIYLAKQYHGQDGLGGYLYGYNIPDIAKTEKKKAGGDLTGAYNYISGDGQEIKVQYWDDGTGFHQIDNVPKILPKQVDDAPDVKAAKEKFLARWKEEAERNSHPIANPYDNQEQAYPQYQQQSQQYQQQPQQYQQQPQQYQQQPQQNQQQPQQYLRQPQQYQQQPQQYQQQPQQYQQQAPLEPRSQQYDGHTVYGQGKLQTNQNQIDYSGQYSENQNIYAQARPQAEEEETTGPPKGFFYSFDYPVGIIVQKEGLVQKREGGSQPGGSSQSGYLYVQ